jgi:predicted ATPase|tara:strand:- start:1470 stop:3452 length:1983 start_codon:yes stop_codon:yes gene_type:complete
MKKKKKAAKLVKRCLRHIVVENFKAFGKTTNILLSPKINLLFGKNSTGKSSIIQALRLYRQSFGKHELTPISFSIPERFRNYGGLDFVDIGYEGLVFQRNTNNNLCLGVGTTDIWSDKTTTNNSIYYKYKYKKNFYEGKKVKKEQTILSGMGLGSKNLTAWINFKDYSFFDQNSETSKYINNQLGFYNEDPEKTLNTFYESIHKPYYYNATLDPNFKSNKFEKIWDNYKSLDKEYFLNYLSGFYSFLQKEFNPKKKQKDNIKNKSWITTLGLQDMVSEFTKQDNFRTKMIKIWENKKLNLKQKRRSLDKYKEDFFYSVFYEMRRSLKKLPESEINQILLDIRSLINFFNTSQSNKKEIFIEYFKKDICNKFGKLIFYKGTFLINPKVWKKDLKSQRIGYGNAEEKIIYKVEIINKILAHLTNKEVFFSLLAAYEKRSRQKNPHDKISETLNKVIIVPVLRKIPKEYLVKGIQTDYVGSQGNNLAELLVIPAVQKETNKWLKKLEIPYKLDIRKSGDHYRIIWIPTKTNLEIEAQHIGLGFPMILPLIVQAIVSRDKIIVAEEPEVHLHPKLECDLADLLTESSNKYGNQFIIETHSEDLLLRILKKIREGELKTSDVNANYVINEGTKGSSVKEIKINKYGQYQTPWKDDLFANRLRELY